MTLDRDQTHATPDAAPQDVAHSRGPESPLHARVMALRPGDADGLAALLSQHPGREHEILAAAAPHLGNATVQRAMKQHGAGKTPETPGAHEASDDASVPNLGATHQLDVPLVTSYLKGPGGTTIEAKLSGRIFGSAAHGSASVGGLVSSSNGNPSASLNVTYNHQPFSIGLTPDGRLTAGVTISGDSRDHMQWKTKIISHGNSIGLNLSGYAKIPGGDGSMVTLGIGLTLDLSVIKGPPRGTSPEPEPVTLAIKTLVPTFAAAGAAGLGAIAVRVLAGLALEAIG
jgi:hypothetical protein